VFCFHMAAQGEDTVVVNKNKRFRKDKRVTLAFSFSFCVRKEADRCFLTAWDTDDIDQ